VLERWQREIPLRVLFEASTVAEMAERIESSIVESGASGAAPPVLRPRR
jgi:hypothetical protein